MSLPTSCICVLAAALALWATAPVQDLPHGPLPPAPGAAMVGSAAPQEPALLLKGWWGPGLRRPPAPGGPTLQESAPPPIQEVDPQEPIVRRAPPTRGALRPGPLTRASFQVMRPPVAGVDPMVAVGRNFVVAAQHRSLAFLDRSGIPLPEKNGIGPSPSVYSIFGEFLERGGPLDLNEVTGFPDACDSPAFPVTSGNRYCINELYDLRVWFDPGGDRFVLLAHVRNPLWTDLWDDQKAYTGSVGTCGVYGAPGGGQNLPFPSADHCGLARRHAVFAVSLTEDPRDGFHTWAVTQNNHQDWPWGSVNAEGNTFVIGHRGTEMNHGTVAVVLRLSDLRSGSPTPAWFTYHPEHLWGHLNPAPVVHHGAGAGLGGLTLMVTSRQGSAGDSLLVFGFPAPTGQGVRPTPVRAAARLPGLDIPGWMARTVYRGGFLYTAWDAVEPTPEGFEILRVRTARIPLAQSGGALSIPLTAPAYRHAWLGKQTPGSSLHNDGPAALAVNAAGDLLVAWHRSGGEQVLYSVWRAEATTPGAEVTVHARANPDHQPSRVDYAWAVTDPVDDLAWWFAHNGKNNNGAPETLVVRVPP